MIKKTLLNLSLVLFAQSYVSTLNTTLLELLADKNSRIRRDLSFNPIPNRFSPEESSYYEGLITESWWAFLLSALAIICFLIVFYLRFRFGYFGGKKLKNTEFTTMTRWTPGVVLTLGFILFFVSGTSLLVESSEITEKTEILLRITSNNAKEVFFETQGTHRNLISYNMMHVIDGNRIKTEIMKRPLKESEDGLVKAKEFYKDVKMMNNRRVVVTLVVFCLGFIVFALGALSFVLKIESLGHALAISMAVMVSLNFLVIVPYVVQRVASTDFCEQIIECTDDKSLPVDGFELGFYFSDFSQSSKDLLKISQKDLTKTLETTKSHVSQIQGFPVNSYTEVKYIERSLEDSVWVNSFVILEEANRSVGKMKNSFYIEKLCRNIHDEVCGDVFSNFLLGEFTVVVMAISFAVASASGFLAPRIFQRWKLEEEQNSLAKHNLYHIK